MLPKNKFDFESVQQLKKLDKSELSPLLPDLMEWLQDMNWPIAAEIAELLLTCPNEIVPLIQEVLSTNDDVWKYWCLECLVKKLPAEVKLKLKQDLVRIAETPLPGENLEGLDNTANEILRTI